MKQHMSVVDEHGLHRRRPKESLVLIYPICGMRNMKKNETKIMAQGIIRIMHGRENQGGN